MIPEISRVELSEWDEHFTKLDKTPGIASKYCKRWRVHKGWWESCFTHISFRHRNTLSCHAVTSILRQRLLHKMPNSSSEQWIISRSLPVSWLNQFPWAPVWTRRVRSHHFGPCQTGETSQPGATGFPGWSSVGCASQGASPVTENTVPPERRETSWAPRKKRRVRMAFCYCWCWAVSRAFRCYTRKSKSIGLRDEETTDISG